MIIHSSYIISNRSTYLIGLVPIVSITRSAIRLCKLQCSTAIATISPPAKHTFISKMLKGMFKQLKN